MPPYRHAPSALSSITGELDGDAKPGDEELVGDLMTPGAARQPLGGHRGGHADRTRTEVDLLGPRELPNNAYFGIHTLRATENFSIGEERLRDFPHFIAALVAVKEAAARTNLALGLLPEPKATAIIRACQKIREGAHDAEFVVGMLQGGAGTSTNMNVNEVVANVALGLMGEPRGSYHLIDPLDDVNLGQSTNDVYPTAVKLALDSYVGELLDALDELRAAFQAKAEEFEGVVKIGRTQLQDAVPMTLGQEFGAFAHGLAADRDRLCEARKLLHEINLGGTAIGTGLNAHPDYRHMAILELARIAGVPTLVGAVDLIEASSDVGAFVHLSGVLKRIAVKMSKTCNDLRLLSSGPRAGLNEINLPAMQAGSSIMPGKVNPVIPEVVNQVAFEVIGHDTAITMAAEAGQLQLNAFEPLIAKSLFTSLVHLRNAAVVLAQRCVSGITANRQHLSEQMLRSTGLVTVLSPTIGYAAATNLARSALADGGDVAGLAVEAGLVDSAELERLVSVAIYGEPGHFQLA